MSSTSFTMSFIIPLFLFSLFAFISQAQVPANQTFKFVNEGEFFYYETFLLHMKTIVS